MAVIQPNIVVMNNAPTSPEPTQGEPHPALRLAEAVCALLAAIAGPPWFWRFLPGGRALREGLQRLSRDFAALMHRIATAPPAPQIIAPPRTARQPGPNYTVAPVRRADLPRGWKPLPALGFWRGKFV